MERSTVVYLVRNAQTLNDELPEPLLHGQKFDPELSMGGRLQASELSGLLLNRRPTVVYTSPLWRAIQTARPLLKRDAVRLHIESCLTEIAMGDWEGKTWPWVQRNEAAAMCRHVKDPGTYGFPRGENFADVATRVLPAMDRIAREHEDGRVVVVTHRPIIRVVLATYLGIPLHRCREIDQDFGAVSVLRCFRGTWEVHSVNAQPERQKAACCA